VDYVLNSEVVLDISGAPLFAVSAKGVLVLRFFDRHHNQQKKAGLSLSPACLLSKLWWGSFRRLPPAKEPAGGQRYEWRKAKELAPRTPSGRGQCAGCWRYKGNGEKGTRSRW